MSTESKTPRTDEIWHEYWKLFPRPKGESNSSERTFFDMALKKLETELSEALKWKEPMLSRNQPCGCVICNCESEERCSGCGSKYCGTHAIGQIPNAIYENHPLVSERDQLRTEVEQLKRELRAAHMQIDLDKKSDDEVEQLRKVCDALRRFTGFDSVHWRCNAGECAACDALAAYSQLPHVIKAKERQK